MATRTPDPEAQASAISREARFRPDVEGLRAVAIGLVLLYHAGFAAVPGGFVGVDVFFVISGFLITTQLVGELDRTGRIDLVGFWSRRAKRLLPATVVVLVATALLTWRFLPSTRWTEIGRDVVASALYVGNWHFADQSVDYLADQRPSPVQHFWSLAVEEQFYVVWPLAILAAVWLASRLGWRRRATVAVGLGALVVASFAWSVSYTAAVPERAFFVTTTRVWELGVGAAVALGAAACARLPRRTAVVLGWVGLLVVAASGLLLDSGATWPGHLAALPVLGTAAVIVGGFAAGGAGVARVLGVRPMQWLGRLSYSLYLWHWPLLVVATARLGDPTALERAAVVVLSVGLAWLTLLVVEDPLRRSRALSTLPRLSLSVGANVTLVGVVAGLALVLAVPTTSVTAAAAPGAAVLRDDPRGDPAGAVVDRVDGVVPQPTAARDDQPHIQRCETVSLSDEVRRCELGDPEGSTTVAVVGDSKISQWVPPLRAVARRSGWQMTTYLKYACSFSDGEPETYGEPCRTWVDAVLAEIEADPPDVLVTSQGGVEALDPDGGYTRDAMEEGMRAMWQRLTALGTRVVVIANNPHPGMEVYECVAEHPDDLSQCSFDRDSHLAASSNPLQRAAARGLGDVDVIDLFDAICPLERCPAVIGGVLIYRDGSHLTNTYAMSMLPRLRAALREAGLPVGRPVGGPARPQGA